MIKAAIFFFIVFWLLFGVGGCLPIKSGPSLVAKQLRLCRQDLEVLRWNCAHEFITAGDTE